LNVLFVAPKKEARDAKGKLMNEHAAFLDRYLRALESFAPADVLRAFFVADVVQEEFPNRLFATGRRHDLAAMMAAAEKGPNLLASQKYTLKKMIVDGDEVAAEIAWSGVLKVGFAAVAPGTTMRAALGMFFTFRDGKIASIRNYDCYYPF
jgi:ketosteroid isomerase-like protein